MTMQTSSNTAKQGTSQTKENTKDEDQVMGKSTTTLLDTARLEDRKKKETRGRPKKAKAKEGVASKVKEAVTKMFKKKKGK